MAQLKMRYCGAAIEQVMSHACRTSAKGLFAVR